MNRLLSLVPPFRFELDNLGGVLAGLTLFSGATEVTLYLLLRIPPVLGNAFFAAAGLWAAVSLLRMSSKVIVTPATLGAFGAWLTYVAWAITTATWSISPGVVETKIAALLGQSLVFLFVGIFLGVSRAAFAGLRNLTLGLGLATAVAVASSGLFASPARFVRAAPQLIALEASYQATTMEIAVAAIICIAYVLRPNATTIQKQAFTVLTIVFFVAAFAGGGRSAAIGLVAAIPAMVAVASLARGRLPGTTRLLPTVGLSLAGVVVMALAAIQLQLRGAVRMLQLFNTMQDKTGRLDLWGHGLTLASDHPLLGGGYASFHTITTLEDPGHYPHNSFLEALAETGLVGFTLLVSAILFCIAIVLRRAKRIDGVDILVWSGYLVLTLVATNFSGTTTERFLTFGLGLGIGLCMRADAEVAVNDQSPAALSRPAIG